ncbi:hypothetical protein TWF128_010778 [Orbilia oligospora]|nr:hypothetical protein TWF128_010778 [Orbilia oligospora]
MLRIILSWVTLPAKISSPSHNNKGIGRLSCGRNYKHLLLKILEPEDIDQEGLVSPYHHLFLYAQLTFARRLDS